MTEAEIIAELTWNVLPSEILGEAIKAVKKLVAERDEARETIAEVEGAMGMPDGWSSGLEGWTREVIEQNKSSQESLVARLDGARRELEQSRAQTARTSAERAHLARLHSNVTTMYLDAQAHIDAAAKRAEANAPKLIEMMEDKDKRIATLTAERDDARRELEQSRAAKEAKP